MVGMRDKNLRENAVEHDADENASSKERRKREMQTRKFRGEQTERWGQKLVRPLCGILHVYLG